MRIEEQARATLRLHIFLFYDKQLVQIVTSSFSFILLLHHFHYSNQLDLCQKSYEKTFLTQIFEVLRKLSCSKKFVIWQRLTAKWLTFDSFSKFLLKLVFFA